MQWIVEQDNKKDQLTTDFVSLNNMSKDRRGNAKEDSILRGKFLSLLYENSMLMEQQKVNIARKFDEFDMEFL